MAEGADLVRRIREGSGLSQAELARRAHLTRSVVNAYERGSRSPGADALAALARAGGHELTLRRQPIDLERNARILFDVLGLAEALPQRRRGPLRFPPLRA